MAKLKQPNWVKITYPGIDAGLSASHSGRTFSQAVVPGDRGYHEIVEYWMNKYNDIPWYKFKKRKNLKEHIEKNIWYH